MNKTYKLYQVSMVGNAPICTYITETQAADSAEAETLLLASVPTNGFEYLILVVK